MTEEEKWNYINELDEDLLLGGVMLSEWTTFLVKDAENAFCSGAYLASILACQAAIESHLRYDFSPFSSIKGLTFYKLIEKSDLNTELKAELHELRKFRNKWIHVNDPSDDEDLLQRPEYYETELEVFAKKSIKTLLKIVYSNQLI